MKLTTGRDSSYWPAVFSRAEAVPPIELSELARTILARLHPMEVPDLEKVVVRVVSEPTTARGLMVTVTGPSADNPVHRAFRALRAIGIQIAHARVRRDLGATVQVLQLTEANEGTPASHRVPEVLAVLRDACRLPSLAPAQA